MLKDLIGIMGLINDYVLKTLGGMFAMLLLLSLYPPLSFIPKFFLLFMLTH